MSQKRDYRDQVKSYHVKEPSGLTLARHVANKVVHWSI